MNLTNLENSIKSLEEKVNSLKGKVSLLEEQYQQSTEKLSSLKENQIINTKAIELLKCVQKATKELIQETFEGIASKALEYIHQNSDYKFALEFDERGNKPTLKFLIKTPDMQESHEIINTRAGGSKDIVALALRLILLEASYNKGFLFLDEPYKRLDNEETITKAIEFIKETQKDTGRQIFIITHKDEVVNSVEQPIILSNKMSYQNKCTQKKGHLKTENIKPKKKRGRPKKEKRTNV